MPSRPVSCQPNARRRLRSNELWLLLAATWSGLLLSAAGCRDTREDTNYCKSCATTDSSDGAQVSTQTSPSTSSDEQIMSAATGVSTGAPATSSQQAGTAASASKGNSGTGVPAAGSRASVAGSSMLDASTSSAGPSGSGGRSGAAGASEQAGRADQGDQGNQGAAAKGGSGAKLDAGMSQEPMLDAGHMQPLPCNGACPPERPVCDESKQPGQCVQCTSADDHACVGDTKTCDVVARKCVQCTIDDAHNCAGDTRVCNRNNRCVVCTDDQPNSCPMVQQHVCEDEKRCVECMPGKVDACPIGRELCSSDGHCIECGEDSQCLDAMRPRCDRQSFNCVGCDSNNDCRDRFRATPYCDKSSRGCVACTTDGEPTCGSGMFCDANAHVCMPGSATQANCMACKTDQECGPGPEVAVCVETNNEGYCFAAAVGGSCQPGFTPQPAPNHQTTQYCQPAPKSSCPAISNALTNKPCKKPEDCGKNGICSMPAGICVLQCSRDQDCPAPLTCDVQLQTCTRKT